QKLPGPIRLTSASICLRPAQIVEVSTGERAQRSREQLRLALSELPTWSLSGPAVDTCRRICSTGRGDPRPCAQCRNGDISTVRQSILGTTTRQASLEAAARVRDSTRTHI